jgi:hypothetical protein
MKNLLKLLSLAAMLLMSSLCYATEAKQNIGQVSVTIEWADCDVGWQEPVTQISYCVPPDAGNIIYVFENQSFNYSINQLFNYYGTIEIFSNPLYSDTGGQRSYERGYTQMALVPSTDRSWLETGWLYRYDTPQWYGGAACGKQRRC